MPAAPLFFPPLPPVSDETFLAVLTAEERMMDAEGPFHVEGRYYANLFDAERARRLAAERQVRQAERAATWLASRRCPWCGRTFAPGTAYEIIGGEPVHARPCLTEVHEAVHGDREEDFWPADDAAEYARAA